MGLRCKRCGSEEQVKNGLMKEGAAPPRRRTSPPKARLCQSNPARPLETNSRQNPQNAPLTSKSHFAAQKHEFFEVPLCLYDALPGLVAIRRARGKFSGSRPFASSAREEECRRGTALSC